MSYQDTLFGVLPLCKVLVGVFYSSRRLGKAIVEWKIAVTSGIPIADKALRSTSHWYVLEKQNSNY